VRSCWAAGGVGGAITISFKEYGVRLNFIPTITPRGTIRLQVSPEVSALDFSNAVTISGFTEPAITVRRVKTEVELNEGQSFAIGGLLDNRETPDFHEDPIYWKCSNPGQTLPVNSEEPHQHRTHRNCDTGDCRSDTCWSAFAAVELPSKIHAAELQDPDDNSRRECNWGQTTASSTPHDASGTVVPEHEAGEGAFD
jgi:hypothetical protein